MSRRTSSSRSYYKALPLTNRERELGELVLSNYKIGGDEYVKSLRLKLRNLEAAKRWSLYYSFKRSIEYAMSILESSNSQWPTALMWE